jgi:hypothetical protein
VSDQALSESILRRGKIILKTENILFIDASKIILKTENMIFIDASHWLKIIYSQGSCH